MFEMNKYLVFISERTIVAHSVSAHTDPYCTDGCNTAEHNETPYCHCCWLWLHGCADGFIVMQDSDSWVCYISQSAQFRLVSLILLIRSTLPPLNEFSNFILDTECLILMSRCFRNVENLGLKMRKHSLPLLC